MSKPSHRIADLPVSLSVAMLAGGIIFNLIFLFPELTAVPPLNDGALHYPLIVRTLEAVRNGGSLWDHWNNTWVLGFPVFHYYQHLPHILIVVLQRLSGVDTLTLFNLVRYLLMALLPVPIFFAMRTFQFSRAASVTGAVAASLISARSLAGFEMESYVWAGTGMYTQLFGEALLPLAVACLYKFARVGRGLAPAIVLTSGLLVSHTFYGYMAVVSATFLLFVDIDQSFLRRAVRMVVALALAAIVISYFLVPYALDAGWLNRSVWEMQSKYDSYGHAWVLWQLVSGDLLDAGRLPVLTLLVAAGLAQALVRRSLQDRIAVGLFTLWVVLFFGRPTWGVLYGLLPMHGDLHLHRFIGGVHFGALLLIGIGAETIWREVRARAAQTVTAALIVLLLIPAFMERARYLHLNRDVLDRNAASFTEAQPEIDALIAAIRKTQGEQQVRVFAGLPGTWGGAFRVGDVPLYAVLSFYQIDTLGYAYHAMSYGADVQYSFDERNPAHYDLFNVGLVVAPPGWNAPPFLTPVDHSARWTIFRAPSAGYFSLTTIAPAGVVNRSDAYPSSIRFLNDFRGFDSSLGTAISVRGAPESYNATVNAQAPARLMFKMNYHPWWTVQVDDRVEPVMPLGPKFTGVQLTPGNHAITFRYAPPAYKTWLLWFGIAMLAVVVIARRKVEAAIELVPVPEFSWSLSLRARRVVIPATLVFILAIVAGLPFLQDAVLSGHDSAKYPARIATFANGLAEGNIVPRWAPESSSGYGDPSLNFFAPLTSYVGSVMILFGITPIVATNLTVLFFLIAGASGFWMLGRRLAGNEGGIVSAAAFLFAPYTLIELYVRGDYSEFAAMSLIPWLTIAFLALWENPSLFQIGVAAIAVGAIMLSSAPGAIVFIPILSAAFAIAILVARRWKMVWPLLTALALGAGLSAFYWMPAAIEKDLTHAEQMFTGWWEYTNHFVPPQRLISSPWRFDYNQFPSTGQTMPLEIGPVLAALSVVACVMLWMKRRDLRGQQGVLSVAAAGVLIFSLLMCTRLSIPLWSLPVPWHLLQFPWRFLITASSAAALLAAAVIAGFGRQATASRIAAVVIVGALAALGLPHARAGTYLPWKATDFQGAGLRQQGLDLTSLGEFRPMTAAVAPASFVRTAAEITKGAGTIAETDHHGSRRVFRINAATSSTVQLNVLYFPGWTASINGTPVAIRPSTSTGLIELEAPAGAHDIEICFENTPVRTIANTLSAGALLGSLALMLFGARQLHREDRDRSE